MNAFSPHLTILCHLSPQAPLLHCLLHPLLPCLAWSPYPLFPSTLINLHSDTMFPSAILSTCPYHLSLPISTNSLTPCIPMRFLNSSFVFRCFKDTPLIHLTILISALSSRFMSSSFAAHVSLPYIIAFCTYVLNKFPFTLREAPFFSKLLPTH